MDKLQIVEYANQRVLTTNQLSAAYETTNKVISNNFVRNKDKYIIGKHYISLSDDTLKEFLQSSNLGIQNSGKIRRLYLWTEKGAFLHAKSLNTEKAWEVYSNLVDDYFKKKEDFFEGVSSELRAVLVVDKRVTAVESRVNNLEHTMNIDYAQQKRLRSIVNEVVIKALGGKKSKAYHCKDEKGVKISAQCFSRFWHDFQDYFEVNSYANLPRVRFNEALNYIGQWRPPTNMQLEIDAINGG